MVATTAALLVRKSRRKRMTGHPCFCLAGLTTFAKLVVLGPRFWSNAALAF